MDAIGILDGDQMAALGARKSQFRDGAGRIGEQALAIRGIGPRFRDDARAVARADASLVGIDDRVDRRRIDQPLLREKGFQSLHARGRPAVVSIMMIPAHLFYLPPVFRVSFAFRRLAFDFDAIGSR